MFYLLHKSDSIDGVKIMIIILSYISVMTMPLIAGQMAINQRMKFYRVLVRLYNTRIIGKIINFITYKSVSFDHHD